MNLLVQYIWRFTPKNIIHQYIKLTNPKIHPQPYPMNPFIVVIAMINGMIGGLILVLPILAQQGGTVLSFIVILVTGFFSFYSCYLCVIHLGSHEDLDKAIYYHFGESRAVRIFYDLMVFSNLILIEMLYFNLIVQQWEGLFAPNIANPICNIFALLVLIYVLKYVHFGAELLGYGLISIVMYCIFLIWLVSTAPTGPAKIPEFGTGAVNLAASMGQAFSIQTFFIPVLRELKNGTIASYVRYTLYAYIIGGLVYLYIAFAGAFGIVNRPQIFKPVETIEDYFSRDQWQVAIVEVIYLVHLYSAFGEFMLVCKKRFFSVFSYCGAKETKQKQLFNIGETIFIIAVLALTIGVYFAGVSIDNLIEINGAVIGFFFIYFIPAIMHFKCLYIPSDKPLLELKPRVTQELDKKEDNGKEVELTQRKQSFDHRELIQKESKQNKIVYNIEELQNKLDEELDTNRQAELKKQSLLQSAESGQRKQQSPQNTGRQSTQKTQQVVLVLDCTCQKPKNVPLLILDVASIIGMIALGLFIMVNGIISVSRGTS